MDRKRKKLKTTTAERQEDSLNWLEALVDYVKETQKNELVLEDKGLGGGEVQSVLNFLRDYQVTDLNLKSNSLANEMSNLAPSLIKTKIKKLNISECSLTKEDLLQLLEALKDSQIADLNAAGCAEGEAFSEDEALQCVFHLQQSKLTTLNLNVGSFFPPVRIAAFFQGLLSTSITTLDLKGTKCDSNAFIFLFANLAHSAVTDLSLNGTQITSEALQELSRRLAETRIEKLNVSKNGLNDYELKILAEGLVNSKVADLDLSSNSLGSIKPLFAKLKGTRVETLNVSHNLLASGEPVDPDSLRRTSIVSLNLGWCHLDNKAGERWMEALRFSNVTKLDISHNHLGLLAVKKLAENIKNINLTYLNISGNPLWPDAFFVLGGCLRDSKLTRLGVSNIKPFRAVDAVHLLSFLELTEGSCITQIEMNDYDSIWNWPVVREPKMLAHTTFTELHLCFSFIRDHLSNLVGYLKFTPVVHLNLSYNGITDDSAVALAECLKETRIRRLNLSNNLITDDGAKSLAGLFKGSQLLYLHLNANKIADKGLQFLAENAKDTFMSVLDVSNNTGKRVLLVDEVLLRNKIAIHKVVSIFKLIVPQTDSDEFCFRQNSDVLDVCGFLENCLFFYRAVLDKPSAVCILLDENGVSCSGKWISRLVLEKFPRQFSDFIACGVEATAREHVSLLAKAEGMGLTAIVEVLLLNRPVYMLDEGQGILDPYVYKLLLKYNQPICNLAVEPRGVVKIIAYFTEHADIDGAEDVVNSLRDASVS